MNQNNSNQSYTEKTAKNSAWATLAFIIASLGNFVISIELTHYFGKTVYGQYSYFIWLSSILTTLAGLGLNQTITKFISRYFFGTSKEKIKAKTISI